MTRIEKAFGVRMDIERAPIPDSGASGDGGSLVLAPHRPLLLLWLLTGRHTVVAHQRPVGLLPSRP